jgi:uncharacterized membrane protein YfcA
MTWPTAALLAGAGICAGLTGSIAGLASLFSYPALLAAGLPPLTANVTNAVSLIFSSVGSVFGSRLELRGRNRRRMRVYLVASFFGGLTGGLLLENTPAATFEYVVPILIAMASVAVVLPRRPHGADDDLAGDPNWLVPAIFAIGIYGGYFGAGAGTMLLALLLLITTDSLAVCNAVKNLVLGAANGIAAILFALTAPVDWAAVAPLALGLLLGSACGPWVVRHAPVQPLRWVIAVAGLGLAAKLGWQAYR